MSKTQAGGAGAGSRPFGLGATPAQPMSLGQPMPLGQPMAPGPGATPGVTPPGVPPQFAHIWHLLPPQLQMILGGQSPASGLLGSLRGLGGLSGQPSPNGIHSLLSGIGLLGQQPQPQGPAPMQASGNPYPVPQSYQTPSTPLAGATFGSQQQSQQQNQGASGNPYQVPQAYY